MGPAVLRAADGVEVEKVMGGRTNHPVKWAAASWTRWMLGLKNKCFQCLGTFFILSVRKNGTVSHAGKKKKGGIRSCTRVAYIREKKERAYVKKSSEWYLKSSDMT